MDKVRDHISAIKTLIEDSSAHPQHTIAYTNKLIYFSLSLAKDALIYEINTNPTLRNRPKYTRYFIPCVDMIEVDINECPCAPNVGCTWMKSERPIPSFKGDKMDIVTVMDTTMDGYGFVPWDQIYDLKNSRKPERINNKYSIRNISGDRYLYVHVFGKAKPKKLSVTAAFDDLFEVVSFIGNSCGSKQPCGFLDRNFDIHQEHKHNVYLKAVSIIKQLEDKNIIPDKKTDDIDGSKFIQQPKNN